MADTTGASWTDIPLDLAGRILRRLPAHVDRVRFAAVCPQWHAATRHGPLPPPLPLLLLSGGTVYSLPGSQSFSFPGCTGYTNVCGDWLVFSGEEGRFLRDPLSNATMALPPLSRVRTRLVGTDGGPVWSQAPSTGLATMKRPPKRKRIRLGSVGGVLKAEPATLAWMEMAETLKLEIQPKRCKLFFCSSNLIVATIRFRGGKQIAVCQPGATSWWSVWVENICSNFVDMAFYQGKLYAIDNMATLFAIDVSVDQSSGDPWISQIREVINGPRSHMPSYLRYEKRAYLVESRGVLMVVLRKVRCPGIDINDTFEFEVFEANLGHSQWFKVTAIRNDEVLFLRRRCSRSVCVSHNALPGGCIFFMDNDDEDWNWYCSSSCKVYSMTDGKVSNPLPNVSWETCMMFGTLLFPQN